MSKNPIFWQLIPLNSFFKVPSVSLYLLYWPLPSCKTWQRSDDGGLQNFDALADRRTDGLTDRRGWLHRTCFQLSGPKKTESRTRDQQEHLKRCPNSFTSVTIVHKRHFKTVEKNSKSPLLYRRRAQNKRFSSQKGRLHSYLREWLHFNFQHMTYLSRFSVALTENFAKFYIFYLQLRTKCLYIHSQKQKVRKVAALGSFLGQNFPWDQNKMR